MMAGRRTLRDGSGDWGHAIELEDISGRIGVVGVGESDHSKASGRSANACALSAIERALEDAGLEPSQIDGIAFGSYAEHVDAAAFHAHFGTSHDLWESNEGWFPQPVYFATIARRHMHDFGTTQAQLGEIAVALRDNANRTPCRRTPYPRWVL